MGPRGDVSKCPGNDCPARHRCHRYVVQSFGDMQVYTDFKWKYDAGVVICEGWWEWGVEDERKD